MHGNQVIKHYKVILLMIFASCCILSCENTDEEGKQEATTEIDFEIRDANANQLYEVAEKLTFIPSGYPSDVLYFEWQYGSNTRKYKIQEPTFIYKEAGKYLITLTVVTLDAEYQINQVITVVDRTPPSVRDTLFSIEGPDIAFVGEEVIFRAHGTGISEWNWTFGDDNGYPSRSRVPQVTHIYTREGYYTVQVLANLSEYAVTRNIKILPQFEANIEVDLVDTLGLVAEDIRKHLQNIALSSVADQKTIRENRDAIIDKYLDENVSDVVVLINGERYNDFYSYCQGIHHLDSREKEILSIDQVIIDTIRGIKNIEVLQSLGARNSNRLITPEN